MKNRDAWRTFVPAFAGRSFFLAFFVFTAFIGTCVLSYAGHLSLWQACLINALLIYFDFTVLHEAVHGNLACSTKSLKSLETLCGWISGLLLIVPFPIFRQLHLTHHAFTNHPEKDPDMWVAAHRLPDMLLRFISIIPGYYLFIYHHYQALPETKKSMQRRRVLFFPLIYGLIALWGFFGGWQNVLFLWAIPALVASSFLGFAFNWLPHHPHDSQEKYLNTRVISGRLLNGLLLGQNYHLIHHLYPRIPFYNYLRTYQALETELLEKSIKVI